MYHYVRNNENYSYDCYCRTEDEFERQIDSLANHGEIIDPFDIDKIKYFLENDNSSAFLLTFDDGYKDHIYCSKILQSRSLSGIFFPPTNILDGEVLDVNAIHYLIGQRNLTSKEILDFVIEELKQNKAAISRNGCLIDLDNYFANPFDSKFDNNETLFIKRLLQRDIIDINIRKKILDNALITLCGQTTKHLASELYLSLDEMLSMVENGMHFGSHSATHKWLASLKYEDQFKEIKLSFDRLNQFSLINKESPKVICYPYGSYNSETLKINQELNISYALTTEAGKATAKSQIDWYRLKRWDTNFYWEDKFRKPVIAQ